MIQQLKKLDELIKFAVGLTFLGYISTLICVGVAGLLVLNSIFRFWF